NSVYFLRSNSESNVYNCKYISVVSFKSCLSNLLIQLLPIGFNIIPFSPFEIVKRYLIFSLPQMHLDFIELSNSQPVIDHSLTASSQTSELELLITSEIKLNS